MWIPAAKSWFKMSGWKKTKRPPGTRFQGAPMPYFMRVSGSRRHACGLPSRLCGLAWLHPHATRGSGKVFPKCPLRRASEHRSLMLRPRPLRAAELTLEEGFEMMPSSQGCLLPFLWTTILNPTGIS